MHIIYGVIIFYLSVTAKCDQTITRNHTNFINPSYPASDSAAKSCPVTVDLIGNNICQIKLDFVSFELTNFNANGICENDFMEFSESTMPNVPKFCGNKTGQTGEKVSCLCNTCNFYSNIVKKILYAYEWCETLLL